MTQSKHAFASSIRPIWIRCNPRRINCCEGLGCAGEVAAVNWEAPVLMALARVMSTGASQFTAATSPAQPNPSQQLILRGLHLIQIGRMDEAKACFDCVIDQDPNPTTQFVVAAMLPPVYAS